MRRVKRESEGLLASLSLPNTSKSVSSTWAMVKVLERLRELSVG